MIIVSIHLKSAITGKLTQIGCMTLCNDAQSSNRRTANYEAAVLRQPKFTSITRSARVENHRRLDKPVWDLVAKALLNMGYGK